jgi:hypothetical protein
MRSVKHRHFIEFMTIIGIVRSITISSRTCSPKPWQRREIVHVSAHGFTFLLN